LKGEDKKLRLAITSLPWQNKDTPDLEALISTYQGIFKEP